MLRSMLESHNASDTLLLPHLVLVMAMLSSCTLLTNQHPNCIPTMIDDTGCFHFLSSRLHVSLEETQKSMMPENWKGELLPILVLLFFSRNLQH